MSERNYYQDLIEIRRMMRKSTRFISLSGLSGILAGLYALIGAFLAHRVMNSQRVPIIYGQNIQDYLSNFFEQPVALGLFSIACGVLVASVITAYLLSHRKASKAGEKLWSPAVRRLLRSFLVTLGTGGLFIMVLIQYRLIGLVAPAMLIFYGLACIHAAKHTLGTVRYLGITCVILGLINTQFIGYGLYFWALGFGIAHMLYGLIMYFKYDCK